MLYKPIHIMLKRRENRYIESRMDVVCRRVKKRDFDWVGAYIDMFTVIINRVVVFVHFKCKYILILIYYINLNYIQITLIDINLILIYLYINAIHFKSLF